MAVSRSELREKIMTILYQIDMYKKSNYNYDLDKVIKEKITNNLTPVKLINKGFISSNLNEFNTAIINYSITIF